MSFTPHHETAAEICPDMHNWLSLLRRLTSSPLLIWKTNTGILYIASREALSTWKSQLGSVEKAITQQIHYFDFHFTDGCCSHKC